MPYHGIQSKNRRTIKRSDIPTNDVIVTLTPKRGAPEGTLIIHQESVRRDQQMKPGTTITLEGVGKYLVDRVRVQIPKNRVDLGDVKIEDNPFEEDE